MTQRTSSQQPPDEAPPRLPHRQVLIIFSGLMLGMLLAALDQTIVATALPTIVGDLGGIEHLSWVVTAYLLASTASTPLWGKLGDLYGRKRILQIAIVIFLVGSALCGLSQRMWHLILFRGLQGLGGGGLIVTAQGIVADVVSPRDRGRYQGIFGSVFGFTSVAGPLLGGFFVDHLSWHWVFYVNLPIGAIALAVIAATLPATAGRVQHVIDYAGTALLAGATTSLILAMTLGGTTYDWLSPQIVGFCLTTVVLLGMLVSVERSAAEPVLPPALFHIRTFVVAGAVAFVVGFAMLGATTFLPIFLQVVQGVGPTASGLRMVPLMAGLLFTSIASGQIISRWGRYRVFPILGTAIMAVALFLLSRMDEQTSGVSAMFAMLLLGFGLGMVMQVLVIAVQNVVDYRNLGAATSGVTFFRSIGSVVGVALFGAVFTNLLRTNLPRFLPIDAVIDSSLVETDPAGLRQLPSAVHAGLVHAYSVSLQPVFLVAVPFALVAFGLAWLMQEAPLRQTAHATDPGDAFGMPKSFSSSEELARALSVLMSREDRRRMYERLAAQAGVDLIPGCSWLLFRISDRPSRTVGELASEYSLPPDRLEEYVEGLVRNDMIIVPASDRAERRMQLTSRGANVASRLIEARRERLADLLADWNPEEQDELSYLLNRLVNPATPDPTGRRVQAA